MKAAALLSLLPRAPGEFFERSLTFISSRMDLLIGRQCQYKTISFQECLQEVSDTLRFGDSANSNQAVLSEIESAIEKRKAELPDNAPFESFHNGDASLGRICYVVARALSAKNVVETGVCYGVTSSYLLQALQNNGEGRLHSIDLPPLGKSGDDYIGWFVPKGLCERWSLIRGTSAKFLGPLLQELETIDLLVHDSQHTYGNMRMEFRLAWPTLRSGGVLIADDIEGNAAFHELTMQPDVARSFVVKEGKKESLMGVAIKK